MRLVRSAILATLAIRPRLSKGQEPLSKTEKEFPQLWGFRFYRRQAIYLPDFGHSDAGPLPARAESISAARRGRLALLPRPIKCHRASSL